MSQFPGDIGSQIMARNSSRIKPRQLPPRIPKPGRGPISPPGYDDSLFSDPGLGGEGGFGGGQMPPMRTMDFKDRNRNGIDDRDEATGGPAPMPGGPVIGYPEQRLPQPMPQPLPPTMPIDRAQPLPRPMPGGGNFDFPSLPDDLFNRRPPGGGVLEDIFGRRPPKLPPMRPPEGGGSDEGLFGNQNKAGYDRILSNLYQDQYRNQGSPYAAQADYLMNRPVFDRGARTDNPMFTFEKDDPFATMAAQQPIRDAANAAALANQQAAQAEQERLAAEEAAAAQAAADAQTAEEAAIAAAEQERVAAEKAAADAATIADADRIAAEMMAEQEAAAAAAAQQAAAAEAMAAQQAAEAESQRLAEEAEAQRVADLQARIDAMEGRFGGFEGRFGNFDPATIRANIAAAAEAAEAAKATAAANAAAVEGIPAVDPDIQARIEALQEQFGGFGRRFEGFDPAAMQANIAAAKAAADANAEAVSSIPKFDDGDIQKRIADLSGRVGSIPQFDPSDIQARIRDLGGRVNNISEREIPRFDDSDLRARIEALQNGIGGRRGMPELRQVQDSAAPPTITAEDPRRFLPDETGGRGPSLPGGNSYADVVAAGNGGINPRVGTRDDGTTIRMFDPDNPNRQGNPTPKPQIDPSSLFSDPGLGGGRAPTPAPRVDNPRVMPGPKINLDTLPGNLTGIGGGRATPLPKTRTRQTVKTPPPPTRTIMPVKSSPAPTPAPSGDFQSNVDFMNQMATKNAQVGSDGQAVMPSFSYDPATNEYVRDSSAFGLTGDAALTRFSPEEFQQEYGRTLAKQGAPAPAPAPKPPRSGPKPRPKPKPKPKAPQAPRTGPKPKVIVDPVKPKKKAVPRGRVTDKRTRRGRGR